MSDEVREKIVAEVCLGLHRVSALTEDTEKAVTSAVDSLPPIELVKNGVWEYTTAEGGLHYWLCSACRSAYHRKDPRDMQRCYRCGAHMRMEA